MPPIASPAPTVLELANDAKSNDMSSTQQTRLAAGGKGGGKGKGKAEGRSKRAADDGIAGVDGDDGMVEAADDGGLPYCQEIKWALHMSEDRSLSAKRCMALWVGQGDGYARWKDARKTGERCSAIIHEINNFFKGRGFGIQIKVDQAICKICDFEKKYRLVVSVNGLTGEGVTSPDETLHDKILAQFPLYFDVVATMAGRVGDKSAGLFMSGGGDQEGDREALGLDANDSDDTDNEDDDLGNEDDNASVVSWAPTEAGADDATTATQELSNLGISSSAAGTFATRPKKRKQRTQQDSPDITPSANHSILSRKPSNAAPSADPPTGKGSQTKKKRPSTSHKIRSSNAMKEMGLQDQLAEIEAGKGKRHEAILASRERQCHGSYSNNKRTTVIFA